MGLTGGPTYAKLLRGSSPRIYIDPRNRLSRASTSTQINGFSEFNVSNLNFTFEGTVGYEVDTTQKVSGDLRLNSGRIYTTNTGWFGNMTMCWWMRYIGAVNATSFYTESNRGPSGCYRINSYLNSNGTFTFLGYDNSGAGNITTTSTTNVCNGNWNYICCKWQNGSPSGLYIFVNGVQEGYTSSVCNDGTYENLHLGGVTGCVTTATHNCYLGPIHSFNSALSASDILYNYNLFKSRYR